MPDQLPIFGFHEMRPKLKKLVSPELVEEIKRMREVDEVAAMRMLREALEGLERRLSNAEGDDKIRL